MAQGTKQTLQEAVKFSPSALVELYELDATSIGAGIFRFYNGCLLTGQAVIWQGLTYTNYAVKASGFEFKAQGELPRPKIQFSNLFGSFTALNINYADLVGAKITRKRVFYRHLDTHVGGVPPPNGFDDNPNANPNAGWPLDIFYLHQKTQQNKLMVEYEMTSVLELENVQLPGRQVYANLCASKYRSTECSYTGLPVADKDGNPVPVPLANYRDKWQEGVDYAVGDYVKTKLDTSRKLYSVCIVAHTSDDLSEPPNKAYWFTDDCSLCLSSGCKLRFGTGTLPFAGFPGTGSLPASSGSS